MVVFPHAFPKWLAFHITIISFSFFLVFPNACHITMVFAIATDVEMIYNRNHIFYEYGAATSLDSFRMYFLNDLHQGDERGDEHPSARPLMRSWLH